MGVEKPPGTTILTFIGLAVSLDRIARKIAADRPAPLFKGRSASVLILYASSSLKGGISDW